MNAKQHVSSAFQTFKNCRNSAISCPPANSIIGPSKYRENTLILETSWLHIGDYESKMQASCNFNLKVYFNNSRSTCNLGKKKRFKTGVGTMVNVGDWFVKYAHFFQIRNAIYTFILFFMKIISGDFLC